jgi:hypothetical protein
LSVVALRGVASAINLQDDDDDDGDDDDDDEEKSRNKGDWCEESVKKKAKTTNDNKDVRTKRRSKKEERKNEGCKCGGRDHKRITSHKCPWQGLSASAVAANCEKRRKDEKMSYSLFRECTTDTCKDSTEREVQSTSKYLAPMQTF